jgi:hypothetical protein
MNDDVQEFLLVSVICFASLLVSACKVAAKVSPAKHAKQVRAENSCACQGDRK